MIEPPYLLFLGEAKLPLDCKSARGMTEWRPELCVAECALDGCEQTLGQPELLGLGLESVFSDPNSSSRRSAKLAVEYQQGTT